jgi:transposase
MGFKRIGYASDVTDEEWEFVLPYLLLSREDSGHREHDLRAVFNGVRYVARTGCPWRWLPNDLPPWAAVYQQMRRWLEAGCLEALVADVQSLLRELGGRKGIILCKSKDRLIVEYALKDATLPIGVSSYSVTPDVPYRLQGQLPSADQIAPLLAGIG